MGQVKSSLELMLEQLELMEYERDLKALGLTEEEIEGNRAFMSWDLTNDKN